MEGTPELQAPFFINTQSFLFHPCSENGPLPFALDSESRQMGIILSLEKTKKHKLMDYWQKGSFKLFAKAHFSPTLILHTFFFDLYFCLDQKCMTRQRRV